MLSTVCMTKKLPSQPYLILSIHYAGRVKETAKIVGTSP